MSGLVSLVIVVLLKKIPKFFLISLLSLSSPQKKFCPHDLNTLYGGAFHGAIVFYLFCIRLVELVELGKFS